MVLDSELNWVLKYLSDKPSKVSVSCRAETKLHLYNLSSQVSGMDHNKDKMKGKVVGIHT